MKRTLTTLLLLAAATTPALRAEHEDRNLFQEAVQPVLNAKCASCHGEEKQKGDLRVDSMEFLLQGSGDEPGIVAGKVDEGSILFRVHLPLDDSDHMPPDDEEQLTEAETALLDFWVASGAKPDATVAELKPDAAAKKHIAAVFANLPSFFAQA